MPSYTVREWDKLTYGDGEGQCHPPTTGRGEQGRTGRGQWLDRAAQLGRVAPPPLLGRQVGVGTSFVPVVPVARLHGGAHY